MRHAATSTCDACVRAKCAASDQSLSTWAYRTYALAPRAWVRGPGGCVRDTMRSGSSGGRIVPVRHKIRSRPEVVSLVWRGVYDLNVCNVCWACSCSLRCVRAAAGCVYLGARWRCAALWGAARACLCRGAACYVSGGAAVPGPPLPPFGWVRFAHGIAAYDMR